MPDYDALVVLGGGLTEQGTPHEWVVPRLRYAADHRGDATVLCLSGFTPHKAPPRDARGFPISESAASMRFLLEAGVPVNRILTEASSWDTIGNAYFARTIHADVLGWLRLLVITSEFHLPRTQAIFEAVFALSCGPGASHAADAPAYRLDFQGTPDAGLTEAQVAERRAAEHRALENWTATCARQAFRTLRDFHGWLFTEHDCYAAAREPALKTGVVGSTY